MFTGKYFKKIKIKKVSFTFSVTATLSHPIYEARHSLLPQVFTLWFSEHGVLSLRSHTV